MRRAPEYVKIAVVALAALVGAGLGYDGVQAPRLNAAVSAIGAPAAPASAPVRRARRPAASSAAPGVPAHTMASSPAAGRPAAPAALPALPAAGPLLSDTPYGAYAYQVYPGSISADTEQALTGFELRFRPAGSGTVEVTASLPDGTTQTATFPSSDRLYFIETRTGDDGFGGETNLGDDGFVLTDAGGHIVGR